MMFKKLIAFIVLLALPCSFTGCATAVKQTAAPEPEVNTETPPKDFEFVLGVGDSLDITVWRNDDLKLSSKINPSGKIMLPLIGEVQAAGKDVSSLRDELISRLSKYIVDPQVNISVSAIQSRRILVMGEVNTPGALILDRELTILEAVAIAGGWTHDANMSNVILLRKVSEKVEARSVDMSAAIDGGSGANNQLLHQNDIVYVPTKKIANIARFMSYLTSIISPIVLTEGGIVLFPQMIDAINGKGSKGSAIIAH